VKLKSAGGTKCSAGAIAVKWAATDPARNPLTAAVDFSADGGATWKEIDSSPASSGGVAIARWELKATAHGRLRVRVSDGFNQVSAMSGALCVAQVPPAVTIVSPLPSQVSPGGTVTLSGYAFDGNGNQVAGAHLVWTATVAGQKGAVSLGTGSPLVVKLPGGVATVRLSATAAGRTGTASITAPAGALTLLNGWTNATFGTAAAAATLVSGIVHLKGAITTKGTNQNAFVLPPAMWPSATVFVKVDMCGSATGWMQINSDGTATVAPANSFSDMQCLTSLDGVSFALSASTPLTPENGWTGEPFGTAAPGATVIGGVVHLRGAIATAGTIATVFTLPLALRPAASTYVPVAMCDATNGRLLIQPDGTVSVEEENSQFSEAACITSLDGATYALHAPVSLTPLNGWLGGPFSTGQPSASLLSGVVELRGAIATGGSNPDAFTLPTALRPARDVYVYADLCDSTNGRLFIQPDGTVSVQAEGGNFGNASCFTSLDGVSYLR
jgi:hypothetical protein